MSPIWVALAGVSPATATFYRCAYAIPALLIIWFVGRKRDTRSPRARLMAFANGIILAADLTIWHYSIELIGAGLSTVLANIQVVFVGVLAWLFHRERPTRVAFQMIPVILVGATLISGLAQDDAYGKAPVAGAILGVTSGLLYASFMLILRASNRILAPPAGPLLDSSVGGAITALDRDVRALARQQAQAWIEELVRLAGPQGVLARTWSTGAAVLWVAVALIATLLLYFFPAYP